MTKFFIVLFLLPNISFGQVNSNSLLIPDSLRHKSILDSINYIESKPRLAIIKYLNSNNLNPENHFIESSSYKSVDTLYIQVWDIVGLETINRYERKKDSVDKVNIFTVKKLKWPRPVGNPGNCFTAYFDLENEKLIRTEYWQ